MTRATAVADDWSARLRSHEVSIDRLLDARSLEEALRGAAEPLSKPGLGSRERWRWTFGGATLFLKRYRGDGWRGQFDRILRQSPRHSRAWWEFTQSAQLGEAGVPAVRAVGFGEEMSGLIERRSVVLFERAAGEALDRRWRELSERGSPLTRGLSRHEIAQRLGRFVAAFHGTGLCHRDLYLCHIFAELDDAGAQPPRFTLIDLARLHRPRWRRMRWIIKDLAQLDCSARQVGASRADRLRCLYAYLGLHPGAPRARVYARRVARKSDAILARIRRRAARS